MALNIIRLGPEYIGDPIKGKPISNGKIFIGEPDKAPQDFPKTVSLQQESGVVVQIIQPILTGAGGYPLYNGSTVTMYVEGDYSMQVLDSSDVQVYYIPSMAADPSGSLPSVKRELIVSTAGQTVFTLSNAYTTGTDSLMITDNGVLVPQSDYTETDATTVTFVAGIAVGHDIEFISGGVSTATIEATAVGYTATGSSNSTNVSERLNYLVFVNDEGVDVADFQTVIDRFPNFGLHAIHVAAGTYTGDMSTLSYGARTIVFIEEGGVAYSTPPTAARLNFDISADGRVWQSGYFGMQLTPLGTLSEPSNVKIQRDVSYTGGTALNPSAFSVKTNITSNNGTKENAIISETDDNGAGSGNSRTAIMSVARRNVDNTNNIITANIIAEDNTTRASSINPGSLVAAEIDIDASGPDDAVNGRRFGLDILLREKDVSADGATEGHAAIRIRNESAGGSAPSTWLHGVFVKPDSANGNVTNAFTVEGSPVNVLLSRTDNIALIDHGSNLDAGAFATHQFTAKDSVGGLIPYAQTKATVADNTTGSASGRLDLVTRQAGTLTNEVGINAGVIVGAPTGSFKGVGTINVAGDIYKNDSAFANPDYVFEKAYTGDIVKFADNPGAKNYPGLKTIRETEFETMDTMKLPGMDDNSRGVFDRQDLLLEKLEEAYLHIFELNARLEKLEDK